MSEDRIERSNRELEGRLIDLGRHIHYPPTPDLRGIGVYPGSTSHHRQWRTLGTAVGAVLMAAAVLGSVSPAVRAEVGGWLAVPGVRIFSLGPHSSSGPLGHALRLGRSTTMETAQAALPFHILVPADLGRPDAVYLTTLTRDGVSLVYRPRPDLPATSAGVGCLITEFRATANQIWFGKMVGWQPLALRLPVGAYQGYWVRGSHVVFAYRNPRGSFVDHPRLAGNTLLWERKGLTLRLESALRKAPAIHIADSFH